MGEEILKSLSCPICTELFTDPIVVPCCTKGFCRACLLQAMDQGDSGCPLCRGDLSTFDVAGASKNLLIQGMIDCYGGGARPGASSNSKPQQQWSATYSPLEGEGEGGRNIGELSLRLENSAFQARPSLFIVAADRSGSMSGSPWAQVEKALLHILALTRQNPLIRTDVIGYDSNAARIPLTGVEEVDNSQIKKMFTGGGTSFIAAFNKIVEVLGDYVYSEEAADAHKLNNVSNVIVAFLTDGQAENQTGMVQTFKEQLQEHWRGPLSVHAIGFGSGCDRNFLEQLWHAGAQEGSFRYAEPQDDGDTLCNKLQSLFDVAAKSSSVTVKIGLSGGWKQWPTGVQELTVQFPINQRRNGLYQCWVEAKTGTESDNPVEGAQIVINSVLEQDLVIPVVRSKGDSKGQGVLQEKWFARQIDEVAGELLQLGEEVGSGPKAVRMSALFQEFRIALLQAKVTALQTKCRQESSLTRLDFMQRQLQSLASGGAMNLGKLGDLRFGSLFQEAAPQKSKGGGSGNGHGAGSGQGGAIAAKPTLTIKGNAENTERRVFYSRNNEGKGRSPLQELICRSEYNRLKEPQLAALANLQLADLQHVDADGNNTLHLLAYCGHSCFLNEVFKKFRPEELVAEINAVNRDGETPLTLAVKKQGFYKSMTLLFRHGGLIPGSRAKGLEHYCVAGYFLETAKLLAEMAALRSEVDIGMTCEYVRILYDKAVESGELMPVFWEEDLVEGALERQAAAEKAGKFLRVCLAKGLKDLVKVLLAKWGGVPTLDMVIESCFPPKPDDPEVEKYLELTRLVMGAYPRLLEGSDANNETLLFHAVNSGNLPLVQYYLDAGVDMEKANNLGNTPLWLACAKRYPCIITELLNRGANVNHRNLRGNVPLFSICQKGPLKIAQMLLARGAEIEHNDRSKDSLLLVACRHGQHEIVKLMLDYVDPSFVDFAPDIDGFSAIFSAVEADRVECLQVLYEYGVSLKQRTRDDNPIIKGASLLHLAAFYGRVGVCERLLALGAEVNAVDFYGQTPLHLAVIQGYVPIIALLKSVGKARTDIKDKAGLVAAAYVRGRADIKAALTDPLVGMLCALGCGRFETGGSKEQSRALELLRGAEIPGCLQVKELLNREDENLMRPLSYAVIHSHYLVAKELVALGAEGDERSMNTVTWAHWIKNPRIKALFGALKPQQEQIVRLQKASQCSAQDGVVLNMMRPSGVDLGLVASGESGLGQRMALAANLAARAEGSGEGEAQRLMITADGSNLSVGQLFERYACIDGKLLETLLWLSKITVCELFATTESLTVSPQQALAISAYSSSGEISALINANITNSELLRLVGLLYTGLLAEPPLGGDTEVYVGVAIPMDRNALVVGSVVSWGTFLSGSTVWRVATEQVPEFESKKRGTVLLFRGSRVGRLVSAYSRFPANGEVIFPPFFRFRVTKWIMGDVLALGQENIRDSIYRVKPEELGEYQQSNRSLIVQLEDIV